MAQRTDQQIIDDFALSADSSLIANEKEKGPSNYNQYLMIEVLLDIREMLVEVKAAIEVI